MKHNAQYILNKISSCVGNLFWLFISHHQTKKVRFNKNKKSFKTVLPIKAKIISVVIKTCFYTLLYNFIYSNYCFHFHSFDIYTVCVRDEPVSHILITVAINFTFIGNNVLS